MRYFAILDGEEKGPFSLEQLAEAGVRPDTFVWCKGMGDWQKAEEVADICRFYRQRIFDLMHPTKPAPDSDSDSYNEDSGPDGIRNSSMRMMQLPMPEEIVDTSHAPVSTMFLAILSTLICFPITGCVAVFYSMKSTRAWAEAQRSNMKSSKHLYSDSERENLKRLAHDYNRSAKMWIGITFFLGMMLYAFLGRSFF